MVFRYNQHSPALVAEQEGIHQDGGTNVAFVLPSTMILFSVSWMCFYKRLVIQKNCRRSVLDITEVEHDEN